MTTQRRWGCCTPMCSGPVSCKAEDIAPIGTQRIHIRHLYTFIHSQPHRSQTYRVLTRTDGTNRLTLVPSGRARVRSISKNICLCTYVCIGINIRSIYTHTHPELSGTPLVPSSKPRMVLPLETFLAPRPLHLFIGRFGLISTDDRTLIGSTAPSPGAGTMGTKASDSSPTWLAATWFYSGLSSPQHPGIWVLQPTVPAHIHFSCPYHRHMGPPIRGLTLAACTQTPYTHADTDTQTDTKTHSPAPTPPEGERVNRDSLTQEKRQEFGKKLGQTALINANQ